MSVILDVDGVIEFPGPWTQPITKTIHINNPNNYKTIAFKVKTTAPKLYSVRPNSGFLKPKETSEITIMLQAFRKDFSPNQQNRDKFLIVSTLVDDIWMDQSISDLWTIVENHHQDRIHQQKIRCAYALPTQTITTEMNGTSNSNNTNTSNSDNNGNSQEKLEKEPNAREKLNDESTKVSPLRHNPDFTQQQQQQHQQEKKKEQKSQLESINNELNRYKQEIEMLKRQKAISSASNENTLIITILMALVALTVYYYKYN